MWADVQRQAFSAEGWGWGEGAGGGSAVVVGGVGRGWGGPGGGAAEGVQADKAVTKDSGKSSTKDL